MEQANYSEVKRCVSMMDVLRHYVGDAAMEEYRQKGDQLRGACILCGGGNGRSLSINTQKNCFRTFCCNQSGNIFDFVAVKELEVVWVACALIAQWFSVGSVVSDVPEAVPENGINPPLSFALKNIDPSHDDCTLVGVSIETLKHFGIGYYSGRGMFSDHLVFPIHDMDAQLIGYAGCPTQGGELGDWRYPGQFSTSHVLYNGHRVAEMLKDARETPILVPDLLDVVYLHDQGFPATMSFMGEIPSEAQVKLLRSLGGAT